MLNIIICIKVLEQSAVIYRAVQHANNSHLLGSGVDRVENQVVIEDQNLYSEVYKFGIAPSAPILGKSRSFKMYCSILPIYAEARVGLSAAI